MSWYDSKRHTKSHTDMYYLQEHDTRWGHENELCRISVIEVEETSKEYDSAVNNDKVNNTSMMKEWNITWDCLITLIRGSGGDCDTDEEIKIAVGYYLKKVFGIDDIDVESMQIQKYEVYVKVNYRTLNN